MAETPLPPLHKALVRQLKTSAFFGGRVFNESDLPRGTALPYVVIAAHSSGRLGANRYQQPGHVSGVQIRWWHNKMFAAIEAFQEGCRLLDGVRLVVEGHAWEKGTLDYVTDFPEPDAEIGGHVVVSQYRCRSHVGAA